MTTEQQGSSAARVAAVIAQSMQRLASGEAVDIEQLLAAHADLMPELADELRKAGLLAEAEQRLRMSDAAGDETGQFVHDTASSIDQVQSAVSRASQTGEETLPRLFGERYRLVRKLGQGGMGQVYLADDLVLQRQVALKIPRLADNNRDELLRRFQREARSVAALRHPMICPVYDVGEHDGVPYLTMAYIDGSPLSELIEQGWPTYASEAAQMVLQLASALHAAHRKGVIHRDLKPANVIVDWDGNPVVMDFGLALRAGCDESRVTQEGTLLGTPAYMAPEQVTGDPNAVGAAADIYALGVILYELLTKRLPFDGPVASVIHQIMNQQPQPPSALSSIADPEVERICLKLMAKRLPDRYADTAQVVRDLTAYLQVQVEAERSAACEVEGDEALQTASWEDGDGQASEAAASTLAAFTPGEEPVRTESPGPTQHLPTTVSRPRWHGRRIAAAAAIALIAVLLAWGATAFFGKPGAEPRESEAPPDGPAAPMQVFPGTNS